MLFLFVQMIEPTLSAMFGTSKSLAVGLVEQLFGNFRPFAWSELGNAFGK
jgi:hypothetical protein